MSASGKQATEVWTPDPTEAKRIRAEDPDFPVALARARAKARGESYDPKRHGPHEEDLSPRLKQKRDKELVSVENQFSDLLKKFEQRGPPPRPNLRVIPGAEREGVRRVREQ